MGKETEGLLKRGLRPFGAEFSPGLKAKHIRYNRLVKYLTRICLIFVCSSLGNLLWANSCSTIELDKNGGSMSSVSVLDQGQTNTCYSHAGAVMVDAWLHSHGGDRSKQTNPFVAALQTNHDYMSATLRNFSCDAIDRIKDHGSCNMKNYTQTERTQMRLLMDELKDLHYRDPFQSMNRSINSNHRFLSETRKNAEEIFCQINQVFPELVADKNINDILDVTRTMSKTTYIRRLTRLMCDGNHTMVSPPPQCQGERRIRHGGQSKSREYKNRIHQLLTKRNAQPVGVGYCSGFLSEGKNYRGYNSGFLGFTSLSVKDCGLHESVVIGRKMIRGKCHFKIRNSWGKYAVYHPDWQNNYDGNVWVDEETLTANMGSISYLE